MRVSINGMVVDVRGIVHGPCPGEISLFACETVGFLQIEEAATLPQPNHRSSVKHTHVLIRQSDIHFVFLASTVLRRRGQERIRARLWDIHNALSKLFSTLACILLPERRTTQRGAMDCP
jgi:hypothetical protein